MPVGSDGAMERAEQARAVDAEARKAGADVAIADVENAEAARMGHAVQPFDAGARAPDRAAEAEPVEDGETERLEEETGADRPRRVEPFEQIDPVAGPRQEERRRHAGDAAADDRDGGGAAARDHRPSLCHDTGFSQRGRVWGKEMVTGISGVLYAPA